MRKYNARVGGGGGSLCSVILPVYASSLPTAARSRLALLLSRGTIFKSR